MWAPNIQALSAEYHTFAVDQIGDFGRSICTQPLRRYNDLLAWLNEVFDGLELRGGVNLAGISFGGALAAEYALHFPGRLNKVVLLAPGATVLGLRAEFVLRLIFAAIASRRYLPTRNKVSEASIKVLVRMTQGKWTESKIVRGQVGGIVRSGEWSAKLR